MTLHHLSAEDIAAYLDGESTDAEHRHAADHLATCSECRAIADDQLFIKTLMGSLEEPALPRSFALTEDMGKENPLSSPGSPAAAPAPRTGGGNIIRFEPMTKWLSIAAVLALLVLGSAQLMGIGEPETTSQGNVALVGETNDSDGALNQQEPALARGEVREQGESAAAGAGPITANNAQVDTPAQASNNGLTPIEITTIGVGIVALASIASWILIHYRAGETGSQM